MGVWARSLRSRAHTRFARHLLNYWASNWPTNTIILWSKGGVLRKKSKFFRDHLNRFWVVWGLCVLSAHLEYIYASNGLIWDY